MQRLNAPTFFDQAIPLSGSSAVVRDILLVVLGSILLAVSAKVQIPLWPVPVTSQTLAIMIIGATFGWRLASLSMVLYWIEGISGLPVFATGQGAIYFFGGSASAGYLWAFLPAIAFIGASSQAGLAKNPIMLAGVLFIANVIIHVPGLIWGSILTEMTDTALLEAFFYPFIVGDLLKIVIAMVAIPVAYKAVGAFRKG